MFYQIIQDKKGVQHVNAKKSWSMKLKRKQSDAGIKMRQRWMDGWMKNRMSKIEVGMPLKDEAYKWMTATL